jgi:hypothetical protein
LRITPEQEPLWDTVAQTIRDNLRGRRGCPIDRARMAGLAVFSLYFQRGRSS